VGSLRPAAAGLRLAKGHAVLNPSVLPRENRQGCRPGVAHPGPTGINGCRIQRDSGARVSERH